MKTLSYLLFIAISFCISLNGYSQELTNKQKEKINSEIATAFEKSVQASESFNSKMLADNVDDSLQAGFIVNGQFFQLFSQVMADFEEKKRGCISQEINVVDKKITVLADNAALLTTSGNYSLALEDGRTLTGKFAWTLIYSKVKGDWKIIHSHM
ncbi:nuclear transport factor 2 family protein [Prevotella sp. 10(H)]|uniref:nuclear transport factor 2 family protein n=1 Tax=Prevotella sp. 10(H) TaxID=1158294 RepID=UPI0004A7057D|nr:nuclear transport factor 2 family protein [Prevotella sp. 10(H)]